jgi:hypothetical protein
MVEPLRHRQTKGAATDMFYLTPPRHISTLRKADIAQVSTSASEQAMFAKTIWVRPMKTGGGVGRKTDSKIREELILFSLETKIMRGSRQLSGCRLLILPKIPFL